MRVTAMACAECGKHVPVEELVKFPVVEDKKNNVMISQTLKEGCKECADKLFAKAH